MQITVAFPVPYGVHPAGCDLMAPNTVTGFANLGAGIILEEDSPLLSEVLGEAAGPVYSPALNVGLEASFL